MTKKKFIVTIFMVVLVGSVSFGVIHNKKVEAERIAQEEQNAKHKKEKKLLDKAKKSVDEAYKTRKEDDTKTAETAISKLMANQKKDKQELTDKLTKLKGLLKQLEEVNKQLTKTEKSKSQQDIDDTQKLIDKLIDEYLKADKETAQKKLDEIKQQLVKEKERAKKDEKQEIATKAPVQSSNHVESGQVQQPQGEGQGGQQVMPEYVPETNNGAPNSNYNASANNGESTSTYTPPVTNNGGGASSNGGSQGEGNSIPSQGNGNSTSGDDAQHGLEMEPGGW